MKKKPRMSDETFNQLFRRAAQLSGVMHVGSGNGPLKCNWDIPRPAVKVKVRK